MGHDPKPRSPERLTLLADMRGHYDPERGLVVTANFRYDEWCCGEVHEIVDAIATVYDVYEKAVEREQRKRYKRNRKELQAILEAEETRRHGEQLTLF